MGDFSRREEGGIRGRRYDYGRVRNRIQRARENSEPDSRRSGARSPSLDGLKLPLGLLGPMIQRLKSCKTL